MPVSARETFDELRAVCTVRQPQRRQLQTRCPPLRTDDEPLDVLRRQRKPQPAVEQVRGLPHREPQVIGAQLDQIAAYPQPAQRQGWVGAGTQDQMQLARAAVQQRRDRLVDLSVADEVVVIEDDDDVIRKGRQLVDEDRQHIPEHVGAGRVETAQRRAPACLRPGLQPAAGSARTA